MWCYIIGGIVLAFCLFSAVLVWACCVVASDYDDAMGEDTE